MKLVSLKLIRPDAIVEDASARRRYIDGEKLELLAASVAENGVVQPVIVEKCRGGYRLISGKRRVKAAVRAGESRIPAVIVDCTAKDAAAAALVENMCRDELGCVEQAEAIEQMIERGGMTQKEAARRLSLSEAAISLKLKILLLDEQQRNFASENGLTERHLRAIMRLPRDKWDEALWECAGEKQSVAACEREVESRIRRMADPLCRHPVIKDVRIFFNTIERAVDVMRSSGIEAMASRRDSADYIEYTIKIPVRKPTENKK